MNRSAKKPARGLPGQTVFLAVVVVGACVTFGCLVLFGDRRPNRSAEAADSRLRLEKIPFDGARAYEHLQQVCAIGRRPSGSPGMEAQQKLLAAHFQKLGGEVEFQRFSATHPVDGSAVPMANLIVRWHPKSTQRILLCTHYDTLPFPLRDRRNPRGTFIGANDGTSGVAVLMELAHEMPKLPTKYGVDFVLFDGEEFIFSEQDRFFLGSEHFSRAYAENPPPYRYRWGVLLDMVGDADLQIYQEGYSMSWEDTRPLVEDIWATAGRLGVREFISRQKYLVKDDHLPLHDTAKIPTCDVIDFDYPPWHTQGDTPKQCSALSLAKVGWVLREWLKAVQ
jgi:glutaminyl-peptide cyclotransferase